MASFIVHPSSISGVLVIERRRAEDERGFFSRIFCAEELHYAGFDASIAQINHSCTRRKGTIRGLHYQLAPHSETKFVSVLRGAIFDVALDLRSGSPTFLSWHGEILSRENCRSMLVPQGFAHGFQTLTDDCELLYAHSAAYAPESERGLRAMDPALQISWPLEVADISARDSAHPLLNSEFRGVRV